MSTTTDGAASAGFTPSDIAVEMDPRLQRAIARRNQGLLEEATASSDVDELAVIARVTDPVAWRATSEVRASVQIGTPDPEDGTAIVTGRIPAARIAAVRQLPFVRSLKAAVPLHPALTAGVEETGARPDLLPEGTLSAGGDGVVVGIIDYGCDFAHRNFRTGSGRTRLLRIWHQGGATTAESPNGYGREYTAEQIDAALTQPDPYAALGYGPAPDSPFQRGTHGTHVMDICAGNGNGSGVPGFAPKASLVFVDVSHSDLPFGTPGVVESSFGDSTQLLEAVQYIVDVAAGRPCVINISLGTNGGPHDGSTLVEKGIDSVLRAAPNRAVTIAASNAFDDGIHAQGTIGQDDSIDLKWQVPSGRRSANEFEMWFAADDQLSVELIKPSGQSLGKVGPGQNGEFAPDGVVEVFAANRLRDPNNGDNTIGIFLDRRAPAGTWIVRLHGDAISDGRFHAWIERDNVNQSSFLPPHDNSLTIGSISCGHLAIAVGSYDAHKPDRPISWFSSAGPTRDGREKPEVSAPGHAVLAAHSRTGTGVVAKNGTSMAAPAVAGIAALMLGEARARSFDLSAEDLRDIVIASARRAPPEGTGWHDRFGQGRVDAAAAVAEVTRRASTGPLVALAGGAGSRPGAAATRRTKPTKGARGGRSRKPA